MVKGISEQDLAAIMKLCEEWGQQAAGKSELPEVDAATTTGRADGEDFSEMEDASVQFAQAFQRGFLGAKLKRDAQRYGDSQKCPDCGQACGRHEETRPLHVRHGCLELSEPAFYCTRCRRDFFPSACGSEAHEL